MLVSSLSIKIAKLKIKLRRTKENSTTALAPPLEKGRLGGIAFNNYQASKPQPTPKHLHAKHPVFRLPNCRIHRC
jgi:hypothetical protein